MPEAQRRGPGGWSAWTRAGAVLLALLFGLGFGLAGVQGGVRPLYGELSGWWQARDFVPVPATVVAARLDRRVAEGTVFQAQAEFAYVVGGRHYRSTRIGFGRGYDNIGSWQVQHFEALQRARSSGTPVTLWIDPERPARAFYDRELRWRRVAFLLPFATLFPLAGLAAFWFLLLGLRGASQVGDARTQDEWWRAELKVDGDWLQSSPGEGSVPGGFVLFWSLLCWPLAAVFWDTASAFPRMLAVLFVGIGLLLLRHWWRHRRQRWRFGAPRLQLRLPLRMGVPTGALLAFPRMPQAVEIRSRLFCRRVDRRGDDTTRKILWSSEQRLAGLPARGEWQESLSLLPVEPGVPSEPPRGDVYVEWGLEVAIGDWTREFWLPVLQGEKKPVEPPLLESVATARRLLGEVLSPPDAPAGRAASAESSHALQGLIVTLVVALILTLLGLLLLDRSGAGSWLRRLV